MPSLKQHWKIYAIVASHCPILKLAAHTSQSFAAPKIHG